MFLNKKNNRNWNIIFSLIDLISKFYLWDQFGANPFGKGKEEGKEQSCVGGICNFLSWDWEGTNLGAYALLPVFLTGVCQSTASFNEFKGSGSR